MATGVAPEPGGAEPTGRGAGAPFTRSGGACLSGVLSRRRRPVLKKGGLNLVQRYAHVGEGLKREAVEALARGERLVRTDTRTDTKPATVTEERMAAAG